MAESDDRYWLDAVRGRAAAPEGALATLKEGAIVREAMLASPRSAPRLDVEAGARRLLGRLREERVLQESRFGWKLPAAAAAVALLIAVGIGVRERPRAIPPAPAVPVLSGDPEAAQSLTVDEPEEIADELREMMTKAGLSPDVSEKGSVTRLETRWPSRPSEEQLEFLRAYGFSQPAGGQLKIEVRRRPR